MTSKNNLYSPYVISKNKSVEDMRIQKDKKKGEGRFPLGQFSYQSIINFGSRTTNCYEKVALISKSVGAVILNPPNIIRNASDKVTCKDLLVNKGIATPLYQLPSEITINATDVKGFNLNFPIVAKLRTGSGGKGMLLLNSTEELISWWKETKQVDEYFFEEVFQYNMKKSYEYRVSASPLLLGKLCTYVDETGNKFSTHLGEIVILRKLMRQDAVDKGEFGRNITLGNSYFTKNFKRSFLKNKTIVLLDTAVCIAVEACNACGLDFGAVDMIYDSETKQWTVLEINTAPSMGGEDKTFTLSRWIQASRMMLQEKKDLI